jgi:hypothetical protein
MRLPDLAVATAARPEEFLVLSFVYLVACRCLSTMRCSGAASIRSELPSRRGEVEECLGHRNNRGPGSRQIRAYARYPRIACAVALSAGR